MKKIIFLLLILFTLISCNEKKEKTFRFYVATDVHMIKQRTDYTSWFFRDKILTDIKNDSAGIGKFIVVTGDMDPFFRLKESVSEVMGDEYRFYPVIGNHDVGLTNNQYKDFSGANWGNAFDIVKYNKEYLKNIVNWGPSVQSPALNNIVYKDSLTGKEYFTTYDKDNITGAKYTSYSFDEGNSHFIILDLYSGLRFKGAEHFGRISNELYNWLAKDLSKTRKENIFVFAHQPVWFAPDDNALINVNYRNFCKEKSKKNGADSLTWFKKEYESKIKTRDKFWNLLSEHKVAAYFCGHSHHYTANNIEGVWEINLEFGAWSIEGRSRYGEIIVDKDKVELLVKGFIEEPAHFETIERILLKE